MRNAWHRACFRLTVDRRSFRSCAMPTVPVQDWGDALMTSFTGALALFFAAIPRVIGFVLILVIGWFVASLSAKAIGALLRAVHFDELANRSGFSGFVQ